MQSFMRLHFLAWCVPFQIPWYRYTSGCWNGCEHVGTYRNYTIPFTVSYKLFKVFNLQFTKVKTEWNILGYHLNTFFSSFRPRSFYAMPWCTYFFHQHPDGDLFIRLISGGFQWNKKKPVLSLGKWTYVMTECYYDDMEHFQHYNS